MTQATPSLLKKEDQRARDEATRVFDGAFLLEAGAGTGKTATLVARVVSWSVGPGWERAAQTTPSTPAQIAGRVLDGIVAITFTDAAAAEMSTRVERGLATVEAGEELLGVPGDVIEPGSLLFRERASLLRAAIERLTVCTIHSFCRRLLAENPLELGIDPGFQVDADGTLTAEVLRGAIEASLRRAFTGTDPDPDHTLLAARGKGPTDLQEALEKLLDAGVMPADLEDSPWTQDAVIEISHALKALFHEWSETHSVPLGDLPGNAKTELRLRNAFNEEIAYIVDEFEGTTPEELTAFKDAFLEKVTEKGTWGAIGKWKTGDWSKSLLKVMGEEADRESFSAWAVKLHGEIERLKAFDHELSEASRRLLYQLLSDVRRTLRQSGVLTFTDLLTHAEILLREHGDVRRRVRSGLDQLLVDEFQDTDPLQCSIIRSLMAQDSDGSAPGLFLVGDPKQSIYGFRRADLGAYDAFKSEIATDSDQIYRLDVNHRSYPWILDEVQRAVAPTMEREEGIQPVFQPLLPSPKREAAVESAHFPGRETTDPRGVEHWLIWSRSADENDLPDQVNAPELAELEARAVALDLRRLMDAGQLEKWADVGVLFRTLSHVEPLLFALRELKIPYDVSGDKSYYKRREILDASSIVRAVLDPTDHLALIAALRSSFAGVPDAAWAALWSRNFPALMTELRGLEPEKLTVIDDLLTDAAESLHGDLEEEALIQGWEDSARVAVRVLASLRSDFKTLPADRFVERLRSGTAFEVTEAARYLGAYRMANLEIFYADLLDALERGAGDSHTVLRDLRRKMAAGQTAAEGRPQEAERDAVRIFTVHKSKGLEFRHVYLLQTQRRPQSTSRPKLDIAASSSGRARFETMFFGASSPGWCHAYERRQKREAAERVRNLYVALTRAEERLVISGAWPVERPKKGKSDSKPKRSEKGWRAARSFCELLLSRKDGIEDPEAVFTARILEEREAMQLSDSPARYEVPGAHVVLPSFGLNAQGAPDPASPPVGALLPRPSQAEFAAWSLSLAERRAQARTIQERPFYDSPSAELDEEGGSSARAAANGGGHQDEPASSSVDRGLARRIGTEVHRILERLDLEAGDPAAALQAARASSIESEECLEGVDEILEGFRSSPLFERLCPSDESARVVARELACLVRPDEQDRARGVISGSIDLVLQDAASGQFTIVDYKTDRAPEENRESLAAHYAPQLALYARAFQCAFGLEAPPACEVWFLRSGEAITVELPAGAGLHSLD